MKAEIRLSIVVGTVVFLSCNTSPDSESNSPSTNPSTDASDIPTDASDIPTDASDIPTDTSDIPTDTTDVPSDVAAQFTYLQNEITNSKDMTSDAFFEKYRVVFGDSLDHDPLEAENLQLIQSSELALGQEALSQLDANGFVISENRTFETFFHGYEAIYKADLPVYISADSILDAIHRSYDKILLSVERSVLIPELTKLLQNMREQLSKIDVNTIDEETAKDLDFYLAVASGLLSNTTPSPIAGADAQAIERFLSLALQADGMEEIEILGVGRLMDFSQFEPRGHYTDIEELSQYFRSMMWLGRVDFHLVETLEDGSRVLRRRQVKDVLALRDLIDETDFASWKSINRFLGAFVGESDNMQLTEVESLLEDLGIQSLAELDTLSDETIKKTILEGGYGTQQICSHIMKNGLATGTLPLDSSFLFFGQRYVVDSHVFSNLVFDRVQGGGVRRMMPNPLDVAFGALRNNQAAALLADEINAYHYASDLHMMRVLVEEYSDEFWNANLYNLWLSSIRTLSPVADVIDAASGGLPSTMRTEAWGRRVLNSQLASWSELRHDTLLYAKQSYTSWPLCEFPDAYVDPYPEFYAAIKAFAQKGQSVIEYLDTGATPELATQISEYFALLSSVATTLREMAEQQRARIPFNDEQMAFINDAVVMKSVNLVCVIVDVPSGWYTQLFFDPEDSAKYDPIVADVHTQPANEVGVEVGRILHVGTGKPRMMVVTIETDTGPYAYVGPVFSYFEEITENWERYTDEDWSAKISTATPPDVPWMNDLVIR